MDLYILDENKQPVRCTNEQAIAFMSDWEKNMRVGLTYIGPGRVSTVFLRLDHSFQMGGPPVLWETMVFDMGMPEFDYECERYTSHAAAVEGHKAMVKRVSDAYRDKP